MSPTISDAVSQGAGQFAECVAHLTERLEAGEEFDLRELCADCPQYLEQLEAILPTLEAMANLGHNLAGSLGGKATIATSTSQPPAENISRALGDFRLIREIGRGGMGVVYEAEQLSLGRRVALKVLPFAAMLDKQQLARFKNEARAAATLDHPNIVAIYSVGAERGVHYYAMQLIEGRSLAEVIASMKPGRAPSVEDATPSLPLPQGEGRGEGAVPYNKPTAGDTAKAALPTVRASGSATFSSPSLLAPQSSLPAFSSREYFQAVARLGIQAAEALDHAHQSGILHRDIKPANLLMDDAGKLWITDFGLARIEQDAGMTMTGDLLGTLRYMSPEQALAKRVVVDHRSDIYSLGVTLYELLTLQPTFTGDDRQELLRQIAFDEPRKLRQINLSIPRDLETIICKSIEKNPADRYATAQELADDLQRFFDNRSIMARVPSIGQRTHRWAQRHARLLTATFAVLFLMTLGATVAAILIARERAVAARNAGTALANSQVAIKSLEEVLAKICVGEVAADEPLNAMAKELFHRGKELFEEYARQNHVALTELPTYQRLLRMILGMEADELEEAGRNDEAEDAYGRALRKAEEIVALYHQDYDANANLVVNDRYCLASIQNNYGVFLSNVGKYDSAIEYLTKAGSLRKEYHRRFPRVVEYTHALGLNHYNLGTSHRLAGDADKAEAAFHAALPLLQEAVSVEPKRARYREALANCYDNLAYQAAVAERSDEAEKYGRESLREWRLLAEQQPGVSKYHSMIGGALHNLGADAEDRGKHLAARELIEEALTHQKRALVTNPVYKSAPETLRLHYNSLISLLTEQHDDTALAALQNDRAATLARFAIDQYNQGSEQLGLGNSREAEALLRAAISPLNDAVAAKPDEKRYRSVLAMCQYNLGIVLGTAGNSEEAEKVWQESLANWRKLADDYPKVSEYHSRIGATLHNLASLALAKNNLSEARAMYEEALVLQKSALAKRPIYEGVSEFLGNHYTKLSIVLKKQGDHAALVALQSDRATTLTQREKHDNNTFENAPSRLPVPDAKRLDVGPIPRASTASEGGLKVKE